VDNLLVRALSHRQRIGNRRVLAFVLTGRGSVSSSRYLEYKSESLRDPSGRNCVEIPCVALSPFREDIHVQSGATQECSKLVKSFTNDYLRALNSLRVSVTRAQDRRTTTWLIIFGLHIGSVRRENTSEWQNG